MSIPTITTPRLILRAFTAEDTDSLQRILGEEGVLRYFPKSDPPPRDKVQAMIARQLKHWEERGYGLWAVESRPTGELLGRCGLQYLPETDETEVDFILGKKFWGQGLATEAGRASVRYGFEELPLASIVGIVHPENLASRRVLEKLGMKLIERRRYFDMDCYRYAIERAWYRAVAEAPERLLSK